ncbi:ABC transporter ATP-binding protein [Candidatus Acetothermia bacterium]|nr:ABC transporter ATP-binding protein [Candidatus Acetothermia bacterium]MBI3643920.1 ABC transporter ATP-binding protein [Candidatus Acetothermia bacterium]
MSALLQIRELYKNFGDIHVLQGISLEIGPGERQAIIGPNGAGKSTLFNIITGQLRPTSGSILFQNRDITTMPIEQRTRWGIARTMQASNCFPRLTLFENLMAATQRGHGWLRASADAKENAKSILQQIGLDKNRNLRAERISHGDRRLLEIGIALGTDPTLLLLDEPMAGLAQEDRERVSGLIMSLKNVSLLFVEHDMESVFGLADRITVLHEGQRLTEGSAEEVKADPRVHEIYLGGRA